MDEKPRAKGSVQPKSIKSEAKDFIPPKETDSRSMAAPPIGREYVFARKFRWILEAEGLPEFLAKSTEINHTKNGGHINVVLYEAFGCKEAEETRQWIDSWYKETKPYPWREFKIHAYDGCGQRLYTESFHGLQLNSENYDYDYGNSDCAVRKLSFSYRRRSRHEANQEPLEKRPKGEVTGIKTDRKKPKWLFEIQPKEYEGPISFCFDALDIPKRPSLDFDEVELPFLNSRTWLPGQAHWNTIDIVVNPKVEKSVMETLDPNKDYRMKLRYFDADGEPMESWSLEPVWLSGSNDAVISDPEITEARALTFRFNSVMYHNHATMGQEEDCKTTE